MLLISLRNEGERDYSLLFVRGVVRDFEFKSHRSIISRCDRFLFHGEHLSLLEWKVVLVNVCAILVQCLVTPVDV